MKRTLQVIVLVLILAQVFTLAALAAPGDAAGGCPPPFELHHMHGHEGDPMHEHIHMDADKNGDGYLCVKHLPNGKHLHVDNNFPF